MERPLRPQGKEGKSAVMIQVFKGMNLLLVLLHECCVPVIALAKNLLGAAHRLRSQGKPPISCMADLLLLHLAQVQQGEALLMISVLALHLAYKLSSLLSSDHIQDVQGSQDPRWSMALQLRWVGTTISKMWHSEKLARKMYTSIRRVKGLRGAFGASFMKTSIPRLRCASLVHPLCLASM